MTTCSVPQSEGLSFLMEAATALANLPKASVPLSPQALNIYTIASSSVASSPCGNVLETSSSSSSSALLDATCDSANANKEIFPERLMVILNDDTLQDVVTWLPHGRSFVVLRPDVFSEQVLPKYFPPVDARAPAKYPSFTRKVNRWGFRQALRGPDAGAFFHPLFQRDKPELCLDMICQRARDRSTARKGSNLPAKKRQVAILTKESLDAMDKQETADSKRTPCSDVPINSANIPHATVSVSDDSGSTQSNITSNLLPEKQEPTDSNRDKALLRTSNGGITGNAELVQRVVAKRDEEERIRVAKVMLFHAFLQASRDE